MDGMKKNRKRLKEGEIVCGFRQTQQYLLIIFHGDNMFRPTDLHQSISVKLGTKCNAVQTLFL